MKKKIFFIALTLSLVFVCISGCSNEQAQLQGSSSDNSSEDPVLQRNFQLPEDIIGTWTQYSNSKQGVSKITISFEKDGTGTVSATSTESADQTSPIADFTYSVDGNTIRFDYDGEWLTASSGTDRFDVVAASENRIKIRANPKSLWLITGYIDRQK